MDIVPAIVFFFFFFFFFFFAQTHLVVSVCPIKKVFKWRFVFNLERNNRPKIRLQNVKTCQLSMFHSQINVLAGGGSAKKDQERKYEKDLLRRAIRPFQSLP